MASYYYKILHLEQNIHNFFLCFQVQIILVLPIRLFLLRVLRIEIISLDLMLTGVSCGGFILKHIARQICVNAK